jgi:hypothetical protein
MMIANEAGIRPSHQQAAAPAAFPSAASSSSSSSSGAAAYHLGSAGGAGAAAAAASGSGQSLFGSLGTYLWEEIDADYGPADPEQRKKQNEIYNFFLVPIELEKVPSRSLARALLVGGCHTLHHSDS